MKFPDLHRFPRFALDSETTGLQYLVDEAFGFSISTPDGKDYYYDLRATPQALNWLRDETKNYKGKVIYANASFDIRMLGSTGRGCDLTHLDYDDVILRASTCDEHLFQYGLGPLCERYLGASKEDGIYRELADIFGGRATRNVQMKNLHKAPVGVVAPYAKKDTRLTLDLWEWQEKEIRRQGIEEIVEFEGAMQPILIGMEMHGIRVDEAYAEEAADKLTALIDEEQKRIDKVFGTQVNVNSSPQVKALFEPKQDAKGDWWANDGTPLPKTPSGNASLGAEVLRIMGHEGAGLILAQRSLMKTRDTFLMKHVLGSAVGGRVYPTINQGKSENGGTGTGRLSYSGPAMQQIPSRNKKVAAIVKPCFLPDEGHVWVDTDMASFEVRVFAALAGDQSVIDAYKRDPKTDFHQFVADLTNLPRSASYSGEANAKQLNLSMIFNSGKGAIADKMGMPWTWESFTARDGEEITYKKAGIEAERVIAMYHKKLRGVARLADGAKAAAERRGYIFTRHGRRLRFPRKHKTYKASGLLIQANSADLNKDNIRLITQALGAEGRLLLNTHDSYSMSMPEDKIDRLYGHIEAAVERDFLDVPLVLDYSGKGKTWWAAVK